MHNIFLSGCPTEILRLYPAKGFPGLALNKSLKPYCQSVTNPELKTRPSIQLQNQCTEQKESPSLHEEKQLHGPLHNGKLTKALPIRKKQKNVSHTKRAIGPEEVPELISCYAKGWHSFQPGRQETLTEKRDCQILGFFFLLQCQRKTTYLFKSRLEMVRNCFGILHLILWPGGSSSGPLPLFSIILKGSSIEALFKREHFPNALLLHQISYEKIFPCMKQPNFSRKCSKNDVTFSVVTEAD